jgi:VWFA-related protein
MRCRRFTLLAFALCPLLLQHLSAQAPAAALDSDVPSATLHLNVRTVLVDVVVTDKNGKAIPGLKKEDFQVSEDGKPQTVSFFESNFAAEPGTAAGTAVAAPLPPNTFTNIPAVPTNDAVNLLLMDALNTAEGDQSYVHKEMVNYLAHLPPGIRMGVFLLSERLRIVQGFTQDSSVLRASINKFAANPSSSPLLPTIQSSAAQNSIVNMINGQAGETGDPNLAAMGSALQQFLGQENSFEDHQRFELTMEALQQLARYLAGVPGRKNLIWFVGQVPHCLLAVINGSTSANASLANGGCPYDEMSEKTTDMLADARVSIYPIDAKGVLPESVFSAENNKFPGDPNSFAGIVRPQSGVSTSDFGQTSLNMSDMDALAEATGGKAKYNGNDIKGALAADIENGSRYYTLAYTPTDRKEVGKERHIEIKASSGAYKLAYRRGYFEETPKEARAAAAAPATDPLRPLMDRGMPNFTELRYNMKVVPAGSQPATGAPHAGDNAALAPPFTRYTVSFQLKTDGVNLAQAPDGVRHGTIEVALVVYSQDGKPLNWETRSIGLSIRPDQIAIAQTAGIPFHFDIDAPPGDIYLRTGIYDLSSDHAGAMEIPLSSIAVAQR